MRSVGRLDRSSGGGFCELGASRDADSYRDGFRGWPAFRGGGDGDFGGILIDNGSSSGGGGGGGEKPVAAGGLHSRGAENEKGKRAKE